MQFNSIIGNVNVNVNVNVNINMESKLLEMM